MIPDEARESLGNLEAKLFDADGSDASSTTRLLLQAHLSRSRAFHWRLDGNILLTSVICI